jgi:hypothetical protein
MTTVEDRQQQPVRSTIPARLDRMRWTPFHTRLVLSLGTASVLDGMSVTIASSVSSKLTQADTLNRTSYAPERCTETVCQRVPFGPRARPVGP